MLQSVSGQQLNLAERGEKAVELASWIIHEANNRTTSHEKKLQEQLTQLIGDLPTKNFALNLADQCFRSQNQRRTADQLLYLLKNFGAPKVHQEVGFFRYLGQRLTSWFVPRLRKKVVQDTSNVILSSKESILSKHLEMRFSEGSRVNINHIGEAVHGEEEAERRLQIYLDELAKPEVEYISVKVSSIFSQINLLSYQETVVTLSERLKLLYDAARHQTFVRPNGELVSKFVNLDMEEYRDLHVTVDAFKDALSDSRFKELPAGIALQAYLPDSYAILESLTAWAVERKRGGGAPIKVRLVKGANLAMEQVDASMHCWPQAPFTSKKLVDAHFKKLLHFSLQKEHISAVNIGIGSHNVFDIAYAMLLLAEKEIDEGVTFEMLEGMAGAISRVVKELSGDMLYYCPIVAEKDFEDAIAYLTRRLDENTAPQNFLRHVFDLNPGSSVWDQQVESFLESCKMIDAIESKPQRSQNRQREALMPEPSCHFQNEADTDWSLPVNREWAQSLISESWQSTVVPTIDSESQAEELITTAKPWGDTPVLMRAEVIEEVAQLFRHYRGKLIRAMVDEAKKTVSQADTEVSEAIDFLDYYRRMALELSNFEDVHFKPKGIVLVTPPWNFPCAIPTGGLASALMAGNAVLFKPAPETVHVGHLIAQIFWEGGVSQNQLQIVACNEETVGTSLVQDERINTIILTGATETAKKFKELRPGVNLLAETGGKNSIIVTALADRDLAVRSTIESAFSHAGQKCSACSLLILEREVFESEKFKRQLADAASSLYVGQAFDLKTDVNPLIHPPDAKLLRGLTELEEGEEWLLQPRKIEENLWSPGIKWGVKYGSFMHQTELFGPVLGVMCADDLEDAIRIANGTRYGLTAGLQTLDNREKKIWSDQIEAGNLYINRSITGAIVQRQPFGGCKESNFGPGGKAGGPNYLFQLMHKEQVTLPKERSLVSKEVLDLFEESDLWIASLGSYQYHFEHTFSKRHDPSLVLGQDNQLFYVPRQKMALRVQENDDLIDIARVVAAAKICGAKLQISSSRPLPFLHVQEDEETLIRRITEGEVVRLRVINRPSPTLATAPCNFNQGPVLANGRIELLHYMREVCLSHDYHRYGNLGIRECEKRGPLVQATRSVKECPL